MSILYKLLMFLTLIYLMSMFVHVLGVFPYTPFSDIATTDAAAYSLLTGGGGGINQSRSVLDLFFYYDVDLTSAGMGNFHVTSLTIITLALGVALLLIVVWKADIRILITALVFGGFLTMLNSSWTFITKIMTVEGGTAMGVFVMIIGIAILFIVVITFHDKATQSGGGAED